MENNKKAKDYLNKDWKILYEGGARGKIYWKWTNMLLPELYDVLYEDLNEYCVRGKWRLAGKIVNEPKRSIIIEDSKEESFENENIEGYSEGKESEEKDGLQVEPHFTYSWSDFPLIKDIGNLVYEEFGISHSFDYCLVNIYDSGKDGIGWHFDREAGETDIMSISLGCTRDFAFRGKYKLNNGGRAKPVELDNGRTIYMSDFVTKLPLQSGDVVHMKKGCQNVFKHTLCRTTSKKKIITPRINLTYRKYS